MQKKIIGSLTRTICSIEKDCQTLFTIISYPISSFICALILCTILSNCTQQETTDHKNDIIPHESIPTSSDCSIINRPLDSIQYNIHKSTITPSEKEKVSIPLYLNIFKITHSKLQSYFTDYLIPIVEDEKEFDRKSNMIIAQRIPMEWQDYEDLFDIPDKTEPDADEIHILLDFCPLSEKRVEAILNENLDVALINGYPVFLKDFKGSRFVQDTGKKYYWRKSPKKYLPFVICDNNETFVVICVGENLKFEEESWGELGQHFIHKKKVISGNDYSDSIPEYVDSIEAE